MRFFRRSLIALAVAATLPTVLFAAVGVFYFLRTARSAVETDTLARSDNLIQLSDAALSGDLRALNVMSTSVYFESQNWAEFYPRVKRVLAGNPHWLTIRVIDLQDGTEIFDARKPLSTPHEAAAPGTETLQSLRNANKPIVGGVTLESEPVIYLYIPVQQAGAAHYIVAAAVKTQPFQDLLLSQVPSGTAALLDRYGNFVGRTLDYQRRVGRPATTYARDAMRTGEHGLYRSTSYEGFKNYTAFQTSSWSGWSAHIAVASSLIDRPTWLSFIVAGTAGLGGLILAGILTVLVLRDMAERRRADEALRQSQKMEAVGQLTGGIAHDFNNLLTAIIGNLDMIRTRSGSNERLERLADNALEAARRGAKLTSQLLAFSRSQRMQLTSIDLDALLNGMGALLSQSVGPAIAVKIDISPSARFITSDSNQLELALLNLAVNARDAMPNGGELRIAARPVTDLDLRALPRRPYAEICVSDTGVGMTESVLARAAEPFFTTKPVGHGTGLGLSQVYGVAHESGGTLLIDSEIGKGTTIRLILPIAVGAVVNGELANAARKPLTIPLSGAPEMSVLVVDDDRQVRRFVSESLRSLGYRVTDVAGGADALTHLRERRFDLLLIDFAMPGMNGAEVARAAHELHADLKILMVSGYADSAAIASAPGATTLLRKPFDLRELSAAVAEVLDSK